MTSNVPQQPPSPSEQKPSAGRYRFNQTISRETGLAIVERLEHIAETLTRIETQLNNQ